MCFIEFNNERDALLIKLIMENMLVKAKKACFDFYTKHLWKPMASTIKWFVIVFLILGAMQRCTQFFDPNHNCEIEEYPEDEREPNYRWR